MTDWKSLLKKFERPALIIGGAAALTAVLMNLEFNLLEAKLYDFRMSKGPQPAPDRDIVLISIDDATTKEINEFSPLPLDLHARLIESLEKFQPTAIGYLVDLNRANQTNPELNRNWGTRFVDAALRMQTRGIPVLLGTPFDVTGEVLPPYPMSSLPHSIAVVHKDGNLFSEDKVTRRALTYLYDKPVFHIDMALRLGLIPEGKAPRGSFYVPEVEGEYFFFRYHGSPVVPVGKEPSADSPYPMIPFIDILKGTIAPEAINGKIILVGTMNRKDSGDFAFTPYSKNSFSNPKLIIHANILDSVIHNQGIKRAPDTLNWINTFAVTAFVLWWVLTSTPLYGVFATLSLSALFVVTAHALFAFQGLWIRESQPLVGIFLGYYLTVPYRLIREYKKRWDYQRKNELLTQVEELKTNFLSLVTHDLKTPVARIQGLAEVLLRKSSERLLDRDKETVHHILASTDELNRFITSILELNRVESKRVQLNPESKDINQLIEKSVEGFKAQARAQNIQLLMELEPLFPIKVDAAMISKVINNLIDNALKYSPAESQVRIDSKEVGNWVEVSVTDQGIGMSEQEREKLFTRFYRAKNDTTTKIAGTGLGLYLTKYFIEAHQGRVEVQSELGKGSTFKIVLPLSNKENSHVQSARS